jgi:dTDP-4-dehydrorhamnose 3,5-epimerase
MKVVDTAIEGVLILEIEPIADQRGFFARTWDRAALVSHGLTADLEQVSLAFNDVAGTLRGLHFQIAPHGEAKTVRCTAGAVFDVAVDLREGSPTHFRWVGSELSAANRRSLFVPEGCAHGYITLVDASEVQYQISTPYNKESSRGIRWNDPTLAIDWPIPVQKISDADASLPFIADIKSG